jgi:hypothetical protein
LFFVTNQGSEEITRSYEDMLAGYPTDRPLKEEERDAFHALEADLATLVGSKRAVGALRSLRRTAVALNGEGMLKPAWTLVRNEGDVARLALQPKDLIVRGSSALDAIFPPSRSATASMALDALRDDAGNTRALMPRLSVISDDLDPAIINEVSQIACIPYKGTLVAPDRLAFKGNLGELWRGWKLQITGEGLSDDVQELYRKCGVIRGQPTTETSRRYFEWLNGQSPAARTALIDCIIRHLHNPKSVDSWIMQPPELGCIPVEGTGGLELLTLSAAQRTAVVDDMPELADSIRADGTNLKLRLAIHSVGNVRTPIVDEFKAWRIPTLSSVAGEATAPLGRETEDMSELLLGTVRAIASERAARVFKKQLAASDVPQSMLEPQFQRRLMSIQRVMVAAGLNVQFKVRGCKYRTAREWGVLPSEIWLDREGDTDDLLTKAIVDIIFVKPRPRYLSAVLKEALNTRTRDFVAQQEEEYQSDGYEDVAPREEVGESDQPHPGSEPDPLRNNPNPGNLYTGGGGGQKDERKPAKEQPEVRTESIQRAQLKRDHYAAHCQIELARRSIEELAPVGSYAQQAENRIFMLQAHHPDKKSVGGARHAGNLLILSKVNHDGIGTRLSRADITQALRDRWTKHRILRADGSSWLEGGIAVAFDRVKGEEIPIFFTEWHRDYWLSMADS